MNVPSQYLFCLIAIFINPTIASVSATVKQKHAVGTHLAFEGARLSEGVEDQVVAGFHQPIPNQVVKWSKQSAVPKFMQYVFAFTWIGALGMLPLLYSVIDHKPMTYTQKCVGAVMMITVFGGFALFTNIILFQSPHFDNIRPLTIIECIYLMSQVITTVGYGDITPAKPRGQVFVGLYVLGALFVIAMIISDLTAHVITAASQYRAKLHADAMALRASQEADDAENAEALATERSATALSKMIKPAKPSVKNLMTALAVFLFFDICWILFFHYYPGEQKSWTDAIYMSVITLSTVGFGVFTPVSEGGMVFGAFWMLFGSAALVNVITQFTTLMVELNDFERMSKQEDDDLLASCNAGSQEVSEVQFLRFGLVRRKIADLETIDEILDAFRGLRPKDGKVKTEAIQKYLADTYGEVEKKES